MNLSSRLPSLTTILWILASLVAFGAFLFIAPNLLNPPQPTATPTGVAIVLPTAPATATIPSTGTPVPLAPPANKNTPEPLATAPAGAQEFTFISDPTRSGYLKTGEDKPHWGDRNLHAGIFGGDTFSSILFFDVSELAPTSEILDAEILITGLSRDNLGAQGTWSATILRVKPFQEWEELTPQDFQTATATSSIGTELNPTDLDIGQTNQFRFTADQLPALTNAIGEHTYIIVRLEGPASGSNSLFTWDGGGLDLKTGAHPTLRIVARPGQFVIVTNTPTAESVVTAAVLALKETDFAQRVGTPTPFPRTHATATPIFLVTREPTAENVETRVAIAQIATAVAVTTGTYTPTPLNWVVITATFTPAPTQTPEVVPVSTLYARLTPTLQPTRTPSAGEVLQTPVPDFLKNNLLIVTDRFGGTDIAVMRPDGTIVQGLTGDEFYRLAFAREAYSPDRRRRALVAPDASDILQIWIEDALTGARTLVTHLSRGIAYDPVWSPDGGRIAYVSRETGNDELYVYDLTSQTSTQITHGGNAFIFRQRPTWSPDGSEIAFKANDGTPNFQIWIVNADGSNPHNISQSTSNDTDPIWVK